MEFQILQNGLRFDQAGRLSHAWYRLIDEAGRQLVRVVCFKELVYLPLELRDDPDVLGKQWAAVRGLYNAGVDFLYAVAGAFRQPEIGVMQFYGAAAESERESEALAEALRSMAAVEAALSNYPHSRLAAPDTYHVKLLIERIERSPAVLAILGHPDPRTAPKGLGRDGMLGMDDDEYASQQGELLLRGLARIREDFAFLVSAAAIPRPRLTSALVTVGRRASEFASRQRGSLNVGFSLAIPLSAALANALSGQSSRSESQAHSVSDGMTEGWSEGESQSWSHAIARGEAHGTAHTVSHAVSDGVAVSEGRSTASGWGHTESQAHTDSYSHGIAKTEGKTWSSSTTTSTATSTTVSSGVTEAHGTSTTVGVGGGVSHSEIASQSVGVSDGTSTGSSWSQGTSSTETAGGSVGVSAGINVGIPGLGGEYGMSATQTESHSTGMSSEVGGSTTQTHTESASASVGSADTVSSSWSAAQGTSSSHAESSGTATTTTTTTSHTSTRGGFKSTTKSETWGVADTKGTADSKTGSTGKSKATTHTHAETWGTADTESHVVSVSEGWAEGRSVARSHSVGRSRGWADTAGEAVSVAGGHGFNGGLGAGLVPGVSIGRSWQTEDDVAARLTEIARGLESLLNQCSMEGGYMTTALLFVGDRGKRAAETLVPQAFHGSNVPTPVLTIPGDEELRQHALAFRPSLVSNGGDPFETGLLWTRWGTLLTPMMLAAYTAPNLFAEGTAVTNQELIPPMAFYPDTVGDVVLGHQVSPETGDLTRVPLRLSRRQHFHTAFCGDTGYGKSVAAERMVYETTLHWHLRSIVLDFGEGWRKLLNAPGLEGRVEIRQLSPGGVRPLRWNPLQIGRYINPETQWRLFCDLFASVSRLGVRRQGPEMREALRRVYLQAGVLVDDPEIDPAWRVVRPGEEGVAGAAAGTPLDDLPEDDRQRVIVERSRHVGLADLYAEIQSRARSQRDATLRAVLEGILFRLNPLVQGAAARQYAAGPDAIDINEVVPGGWGVAILEGGAFLDDFSKAFLLGWAAWHIYIDAVMQRRRGVMGEARIQIVFEEANKILSGVASSSGGEEDGGGVTVAEQFANMWRDSRKYGIWLHLITQSPSLIPPGIFSSCNNLFAMNLKNPKDRDLVVAALARSEKGLVDERWRRFMASLPIGRAVVRLGYTSDRSRMEPIYIEPLALQVPEPTTDEIVAKLGRIAL